MKQLFKVLFRLAAVCISFLIIITLLSPVFTPKFTREWPTTSVIDGFYELEPDSVDVLFLGSSQVMTAVSPMELYQQYGITAYNLGTEQQNMIASYYLLEEALKTQHPQVVVLEIMFLFPYANNTPLNSSEVFVRKTIDAMHWSATKWDMVRTVCSLDDQHETRNYLIPFLRFHSRWQDLTLEDFTYFFTDKHNPYKGFTLNTSVIPEEFQGFSTNQTTETTSLPPVMEEYFYNLVSLCQENGIPLVLIKTPKGNSSFGVVYHNTVQTIADQYQLPFIDFNTQELLNHLHFDNSQDYADDTHVNYWGAHKITAYLGQYLDSRYQLPDMRTDPAHQNWNQDLTVYLNTIP